MAQRQHLGKNLMSHSSVHGVSFRDLAGPLEVFPAAAAFAGPQERRTMYDGTVVSGRGGQLMTDCRKGPEFAAKNVAKSPGFVVDGWDGAIPSGLLCPLANGRQSW